MLYNYTYTLYYDKLHKNYLSYYYKCGQKPKYYLNTQINQQK